MGTLQARLEAEYPEYRNEMKRPPARPDVEGPPDVAVDYVRRLRSHYVTLEGRLRGRRLRRRQREVRSFLLDGFEAGSPGAPEAAGLSESEVSGLDDVAGPEESPSGSPETVGASADGAARDARRLVGRLSAEVPAADRGALEELAAGIAAEEHPERARTMLLELRLGVQRANDRVEEARVEADRRLAEAVGDLREKLLGFGGDDVAKISAELDLVEQRRATLDGDIADRVEAVVRGARERNAQQYVAMVMREELERLGYAVEEGFDSIFSGGGSTLLKKTDEEELGVVVDVAGNAIGVEPVRVAASGRLKAGKGARRDGELESAWCRDFAEVRQAMAGRGVDIRVGKRLPVGVRRLKVHEGEGGRKEAASASRAKRSRRRKPQVRQAGR